MLAVLTVLVLLAVAGCQRSTEVVRTEELVRQSVEASKAGDYQSALELLNRAIDARPVPYVYYHRAKVYLKKGDESAALADCEKGLELDPEYRDLRWYYEELKKPAPQRFQGANALPPSAKR